MQQHQERVVNEKAELDVKLSKLREFFQGSVIDTVDDAEKDRLRRQAEVMDDYSAILGERIAAFS